MVITLSDELVAVLEAVMKAHGWKDHTAALEAIIREEHDLTRQHVRIRRCSEDD